MNRHDPVHLVDRDGNTHSVEAARCVPDLSTVAGWPSPTEPEPDEERLEAWTYDSVCEATDGCTVEPDGICEHGHPSWLLAKGLI